VLEYPPPCLPPLRAARRLGPDPCPIKYRDPADSHRCDRGHLLTGCLPLLPTSTCHPAGACGHLIAKAECSGGRWPVLSREFSKTPALLPSAAVWYQPPMDCWVPHAEPNLHPLCKRWQLLGQQPGLSSYETGAPKQCDAAIPMPQSAVSCVTPCNCSCSA